MQAFEQYDSVEDLGLFSYNSRGASKNFLQVRFLKFWISFSTTTPIAQAFEQNDSVEEYLL